MSVFLAFETFGLVPTILFFPFLINLVCRKSQNPLQAFWAGFFISFVIMIGGFYWVVYVIHEFGQLSWLVSAGLFLAFCGFGALNFPIFSACAHYIHKRILRSSSQWVQGFWFVLGFPALFTLIEWGVPKLFPWYLGHALYQQLWLIQICEITGATFLTFALFSMGSTLGWYLSGLKTSLPPSKLFLLFPLSLLALLLGFSFWTFNDRVFDLAPPLRVALIQANIGNLDKLSARQGVLSRVDLAVRAYEDLSRQSLIQKPDLLVWPETAIPFRLDSPGKRQTELFELVKTLGVPLISGAYAQSSKDFYRDYNAAFLVDPQSNPPLKDVYYKNILLAFGEYLPLGETFPQLYRMFPQVSDFDRGSKTNAFTTSTGYKLGISICYEAIVPSFMRRVAQEGVQGLVNLTNDSWFGPTSEPYLHGALSIFRSIEHRLPLIRVTNTGASFTVSHLGKVSRRSSIYEPQVLVEEVRLHNSPNITFYTQYGDWFIYFLILLLAVFFTWMKGTRAPLSD